MALIAIIHIKYLHGPVLEMQSIKHDGSHYLGGILEGTDHREKLLKQMWLPLVVGKGATTEINTVEHELCHYKAHYRLTDEVPEAETIHAAVDALDNEDLKPLYIVFDGRIKEINVNKAESSVNDRLEEQEVQCRGCKGCQEERTSRKHTA